MDLTRKTLGILLAGTAKKSKSWCCWKKGREKFPKNMNIISAIKKKHVRNANYNFGSFCNFSQSFTPGTKFCWWSSRNLHEITRRNRWFITLLFIFTDDNLGKFSIVPKPELTGFWGQIPLLNQHLRWQPATPHVSSPGLRLGKNVKALPGGQELR